MIAPFRAGLFKLSIALFIVLALVLALSTWSYLNFDLNYGFLKLKQDAISTGWYLPFYYAHIFAGGIILIAGLFQFSGRLRSRLMYVHRRLGYIYVFGILCFAAPGGMVMSFFIDRGPLVLASFIIQCLLWFWFTWEAFRKIIHRDILGHEKWMARSFSLTAAAVTLRIYIFAASFYFDLTQPLAYGLFAWLSWAPNLAVAEFIWIKKLHPPQPRVN